jgi:FO synthase
VLEIARAGAEAGCKEALFTLGDKPEKRYPEARRELREMGFGSTIEYLVHCCRLVLEETGLLPHANPGVLLKKEVRALREVSVSQGIMVEQISGRLLGREMAHWASPDKVPERRLETLEAAGRLAVPFTTGLLIGIGETVEERVDTLLAIREQHEKHGHLQECIVQNFRAKPGTRMQGAPEPSENEMLATIALARLLLPESMAIQAPPPNLAGSSETTGASYARYIDAGINDWGGPSAVTLTSEPERPGRTSPSWRRRPSARGLPAPRTLACTRLRSRHGGVDRREASLRVWAAMDAEGSRGRSWARGPRGSFRETVRGARGHLPRMRPEFVRALPERASGPNAEEIALLFTGPGTEFELLPGGGRLRREVNGDEVTYVVNRNINYTNQCYFRCRFCAFSKGPKSLNLRGDPIPPRRRRGRPSRPRSLGRMGHRGLYAGRHSRPVHRQCYLEYLRAVKEEVPGMQRFTPLPLWRSRRGHAPWGRLYRRVSCGS